MRKTRRVQLVGLGLVCGGLLLMTAIGGCGQSAATSNGQRVYLENCAGCHQADGQGIAGLYPPLVGAEWVVGAPSRLMRITLHGPTGPYTVKGVRYANGTMPGFARLNDGDLADMLSYVRSAWGNRAGPVRAEDIAAIRQQAAGRKTPWTASELLALPEVQASGPETGADAVR